MKKGKKVCFPSFFLHSFQNFFFFLGWSFTHSGSQNKSTYKNWEVQEAISKEKKKRAHGGISDRFLLGQGPRYSPLRNVLPFPPRCVLLERDVGVGGGGAEPQWRSHRRRRRREENRARR